MGFLDADSVRDSDGVGITVSYWRSLKAIENWKYDALQMQWKELGWKIRYQEYFIHICKVETENIFPF